MNYIYDVLLNFKDIFYDFYDWNKSDNISHIRKIPIFKINSSDLTNIINYKIKFDDTFLELIDNKCELFSNGSKKIKHCCLLSDGNIIIGIKIDNNRMKISSLLIDEELDSLEDVYDMSLYGIKYTIIKERDNNFFQTRKQMEYRGFLKNELYRIKNDKDKLIYLYYECFNVKENNPMIIVDKLINAEDEKVIDKLYKFFKLTSVNK